MIPPASLGAYARKSIRGAAVGLIELYRMTLSPLLVAMFGASCRFEPSCSAYARQALWQHGLWRGGWLALVRLGRCHPLGGHGYDPVPSSSSASSR